MAKITLTIGGNISDIQQKIETIRSDLRSIGQSPIRINVEASGLDAVQRQIADFSSKPIKLNVDTNGVERARDNILSIAKTTDSAREAFQKDWERTVTVTKESLGKIRTVARETWQEEEGESERVTETIKTNYEEQRRAAEKSYQAQVKAADTASAAMLRQHNAEMDALNDHISALNQQIQQSHSAADEQAVARNQALSQAVDDLSLSYKSAADSAAVFRAEGLTPIETAMNEAGYAMRTYTGSLAELRPAVEQANTPIQDQIDAIHGIGREYKSAAESAAVFMSNGLTPAMRGLESAAYDTNIFSGSLESAWRQLREGSWIADMLGDSLDNIIAKMAAWQVVGAGVATVIRSFKDAVETLKEVDSELTNIQKVTYRTNEQMAALGETAFDVASKYGVAAQDYLQSVSEFAKAGFGDQSESMAELATKTQLVGDVSAETANKFLLSANAAWKLGGDVDKLSAVLDNANAVENNFATSIQKIAEGFPIVASTAAQAGMSVEEMIAMLGTISSVTQETGNKAATAARALILNLIGSVGEFEDGITVTEESVKDLNAVLNVYAADAMKAAEAQGRMIDPMEAIAALAKASEEGLLNEAELFDLLSGLGGKLRTNQLTALVTNFDMINEQLEVMSGAAGSADREIGVMLSSWEAKLNILSNTWTQFISHLVDTDTIKNGIDMLTGLVKVLDAGVGEYALLTVEVYGFLKALAMFSNTAIFEFFSNLITGATTARAAFQQLGAALLVNPTAWAAGIALVIFFLTKLDSWLDKIDGHLNVSYQEQLDLLRDINAEYEKQFGVGSEYDDLKNRVDELTGAEQARLDVLEGQRLSMEKQIEDAKKLAATKWLEENSRTTGASNTSKDGVVRMTDEGTRALKELNDALSDAEALMDGTAESAESYNTALSKVVSAHKERYDQLKLAQELGVELNEQEKEFIENYEKAAVAVKEHADAQKENAKTTEEAADATKKLTDAQESVYQTADQLEAQCKAVSAALNDYKNYGNLTTDSINGLKDQIPGLLELLYDEQGKLTDVGIEALETANKLDSTKAATEYLQAAAQRANYANLIAQIQAAGAAAVTSAGQIAAMLQMVGLSSNAANAQARGMALTAKLKGTTVQSELSSYLNSQIASINSQMNSITATSTKTSGGSKSSGGSSRKSSSGGGGGGSSRDTELERLKAIVALEKEESGYLEDTNASTEKRIKKMKDVQTGLHNEAKYLRSSAAYQTAQAKSQKDVKLLTAEEAQLLQSVVDLSAEWWTWQEKIKKAEAETQKNFVDLRKAELDYIEKSGKGEEERLDKIRDIQSALHEQAEALRRTQSYLDGEPETLAEIVKLSAEWWEWQDKIAELLREPYQEAISQREKELSVLKDMGAENIFLLAGAQKVTAAQADYLRHLRDSGATQGELLDGIQAYLRAKKTELEYQQAIVDAGKKQKDLELQRLTGNAALRKTDVDLAQKLGLSTEEQLGYMRAYAEALAEQGRFLEANGASQAEINQLALTYLGAIENIYELENGGEAASNKLQQDKLSDLRSVISLRESELKLIEAMGGDLGEQVAKYREILNATEDVGKYMDEIGASQKDVNDAAADWYNTLAKILSLQQKLLDDLVDEAGKYLDTEQEAATGPLKEQFELLKAQKEEAQERREEEEKLLAVEKARQALENARDQRNVRVYNAASGQWEWVADHKNVKSAEDALKKAEQDLDDYRRKSSVDALDEQIKAIEETFKTLKEALKDGAKGISDGTYTYEEAYRYIGDKMRAIYNKYGVDLTGIMNTAVGKFRDVSLGIDETREEIRTAQLSFGKTNTELKSLEDSVRDESGRLSLAFGRLNAEFEDGADALSTVTDLLGQIPEWIRSLLSESGVDPNAAGSGNIYTAHTKNGQVNSAGGTTYQISSSTGTGFIENALPGDTLVGGDGSYWTKNADGSVTIEQNGVTYYYGGNDYVARTRNGQVNSVGGTEYAVGSSTGRDFIDNAEAGATLTGKDGSFWKKDANGLVTISQNGILYYYQGTLPGQAPQNTQTGGTTQTPSQMPSQTPTQSGGSGGIDPEILRIANEHNVDLGVAADMHRANLRAGYKIYDRGGVLDGMGGIKATEKPELVLGPRLTELLLEPKRNEEAERAMRNIGIMYGEKSTPVPQTAGNRIGTQNNGDTFNINGIDVRSIVNRGTTIGELADMARDLGLS